MREITTHHDGHQLAESIGIYADAPGPGGASHHYVCTSADADDPLAEIHFRRGARDEAGSVPGITSRCLLAILEDHLSAFQRGPYPCPHNELALEHIRGAMDAMQARADERAARGVLGKHQK